MTHPNSKGAPAQGVWQDCRPGTIENLVNVQTGIDRRRMIKSVGIASITIIGATATTAYFLKNDQVPVVEEALSCTDFLDNVHDYLSGRLAPSFALEMRAHLELCAGCAQWFSDEFPYSTI